MTTKLSFVIAPDHLAFWFPLLQQGFQVQAQVGCDVQTLLCDQFKIPSDYLLDRITTIFIDGKPVDDVGTAQVSDGATLALSAAMPGLVGATFRRAGCLASFRGTISYRQEADGSAFCHEGTITLKLFNLLIQELGPLFLERGIWIRGHALHKLMETYQWKLPTFRAQMDSNGRTWNLNKMSDLHSIGPQELLELHVYAESAPSTSAK